MLSVFSTEVKFWTNDATELQLVAQCQNVIAQYRADQNRRLLAEANAQVVQQTAQVDNVPPAPQLTQRERNMVANGLASSARTESPEVAPPVAIVGPTEKDAIAALREMLDKNGLPAVKALLDEFKVSRVGELTHENRALFVARATEAAQKAGGAQ